MSSAVAAAVVLLIFSVIFFIIAYFVSTRTIPGVFNWWFVALYVISFILWIIAFAILIAAHNRMRGQLMLYAAEYQCENM